MSTRNPGGGEPAGYSAPPVDTPSTEPISESAALASEGKAHLISIRRLEETPAGVSDSPERTPPLEKLTPRQKADLLAKALYPKVENVSSEQRRLLLVKLVYQYLVDGQINNFAFAEDLDSAATTKDRFLYSTVAEALAIVSGKRAVDSKLLETSIHDERSKMETKRKGWRRILPDFKSRAEQETELIKRYKEIWEAVISLEAVQARKVKELADAEQRRQEVVTATSKDALAMHEAARVGAEKTTVGAREEAMKILAEAKVKAGEIIAGAEKKEGDTLATAEKRDAKMITDAKAKVDELKAEARAEAQRLESLRVQGREAEMRLAELRAMQREILTDPEVVHLDRERNTKELLRIRLGQEVESQIEKWIGSRKKNKKGEELIEAVQEVLKKFGTLTVAEKLAVLHRFVIEKNSKYTPKFKRWLELVWEAGESNPGLLYEDASTSNTAIEKDTEVVDYFSPETIEKAKEFGLELQKIEANPEADQLVARVLSEPNEEGYIDIMTAAGQDEFCLFWNEACPEIPPPCVPRESIWKRMAIFQGVDYPEQINKADGNFWYLQQLKAKKIITNLEGSSKPITTHFGEAEYLLVDAWEENDYDASSAAKAHSSKLLQELLGNSSTVNIKREKLDVALWAGDPAERRPSVKHKDLLAKLGVDPDQFELRCISQDEYARVAVANGWGKKALWTNFDHYFLEVGGARYGLSGGARGRGGASYVGSYLRGSAHGDLAVRLVLSRKQNLDSDLD